MIKRIINKTNYILSNYGLGELVKTTQRFLLRKISPKNYFHTINSNGSNGFLLFVTGEPKNSTSFYRCDIPKEQLESLGYKTDIVYSELLKKEDLANYKHIVWYRMPYPEEEVQSLNSKVIFSVDDLIFDKDSLTEQSWTKKLEENDKEALLSKAKGMKEFIEKSQLTISSTRFLANEIKKINDIPVFVHKNGFSEKQFRKRVN